MNKLICDFCCSRERADMVCWDYPAEAFTMVVTSPVPFVYSSDGHWAACPKCHRLIDDNKREELVERSLQKFFANEGVDMNAVPLHVVGIQRALIKELHDNFFSHRTGICRLVK